MIAWHALVLAARSLLGAPGRSGIVIVGLAVALGLPAVAWRAADHVEETLLARAEASPVLIGPRGSPFEITLAALFFRGSAPAQVPAGLVDEVFALDLGIAVPILVGHRAAGHPLIATSADYYDARGLRFAQGRPPAVPGELVVGASLSSRAGLGLGDHLRSDRAQLYDLAGASPVGLRVVGVLAPSHGPDDEVLLTDLLTAWAIEGALHAHLLAQPQTEAAPESTASIYLTAEISEETLSSFHLHGDPASLPVTAVLVFPPDTRRRDQALGEWADHPELASVQPVEVVSVLVDLLVQARDLLLAWLALVALATGLLVGLVLLLAARLRREELGLMVRLGASKRSIVAMLTAEVALLLSVAGSLASLAGLSAPYVVGLWLGS